MIVAVLAGVVLVPELVPLVEMALVLKLAFATGLVALHDLTW